MRTGTNLIVSAIVVSAFLFPPAAPGQVTTTEAGAPGVATTRPAGIDEPFQATIVQITGNARYALVDAKGTPGDWREAKVGDRLPAGTQIRTYLRSRVVLAFGDDTVVAVDSATKISIDEFHRAGNTKRVNVGLAHGLVRGGVRETTLRSDMTIRSPTATLSKEGTLDFGMQYDAGTAESFGFLQLQGLVKFTSTLTGQSRYLGPGQYVAQAMIQWVEALQQYYPAVIDSFGTTAGEQGFVMNNGSGLGSFEPGGGASTYTITVRGTTPGGGQVPTPNPPINPPVGPKLIPRGEGNFGTGGGTVSPAKMRRG